MTDGPPYVRAGFTALTAEVVAEDARAFSDFCKRAFDAEATEMVPGPDNASVLHGTLRIGDTMLFIADASPVAKSTSSNLYLYVPDADTTFARAIAAGATVAVPVSVTAWGDRWGMVLDPFGNYWQIATHLEDVSPEEIVRRLRYPGAPYLVVLTPGADHGRRIYLTKDQLVIGRAATCDVRLDDPYVSRNHAMMQRQGGTVYLQDLGSSGGTFVNEAAVTTSRVLHSGDIVRFADVQLRYEAGEAAGDQTRIRAVPSMLAEPAVADSGRRGVRRSTSEVVRSYFDYMNAGRWDDYLALYAEDVVMDEQMAGHHVGKDHIRQALGMLQTLQASPNFHNELERTVVDGDTAVALWHMTLVAPNGASVDCRGANYYELRDGLISYFSNYHDTVPFQPVFPAPGQR